MADIRGLSVSSCDVCVQIMLFFFSTSKYCCVALLKGSSSTLETELTRGNCAEATSSSAVAEEEREMAP